MLGSAFVGVSWVQDTFVTQSELTGMYVELREWQVDFSLEQYDKIGIQNLTSKQQRKYDILVKQQAKLDEKRKKLLGLSTD